MALLEMMLKTLSEELRLGVYPQKDKEQTYSLTFTEALEVKIKESEEDVTLFARIGPCPQEKREELFTHLMKANFLGQGTGGACIGFDEAENSLTLSWILPYDMDYKTLRNAIEDFVNYVDYWKTELAAHKRKIEEDRLG